MIKIIEGGMEFIFETKSSHDGCGGCPASGEWAEWCGTRYPNTGRMCEAGRGDLRCISATPVQDEAKVYGPHNKEDARHLIGSTVEVFVSGGGFVRSKLSNISSFENIQNAFYLENEPGGYSTIREIPARRLTQAQIIEAHPDLEGVELVGGWG